MKLLFNFFCRDIEAQLRYYQALLDLPEAEHSRSPIYRAVATDDFQFGFHAQPAYGLLGLADRAPTSPKQEQPLPLAGYPTFLLDSPADIDRVAARAVALGGRLVQGPYPTYYSQWQAVLADPEDNVFRITANGLPPGVAAATLSLPA